MLHMRLLLDRVGDQVRGVGVYAGVSPGAHQDVYLVLRVSQAEGGGKVKWRSLSR